MRNLKELTEYRPPSPTGRQLVSELYEGSRGRRKSYVKSLRSVESCSPEHRVVPSGEFCKFQHKAPIATVDSRAQKVA